MDGGKRPHRFDEQTFGSFNLDPAKTVSWVSGKEPETEGVAASWSRRGVEEGLFFYRHKIPVKHCFASPDKGED